MILSKTKFSKTLAFLLDGLDQTETPISDKKQRTFRKELKYLLGLHNTYTKTWHKEAKKLSVASRYRRLTHKEVYDFNQLRKIELAKAMVMPIRRRLDYAGLARKIFTIEPLPTNHNPEE